MFFNELAPRKAFSPISVQELISKLVILKHPLKEEAPIFNTLESSIEDNLAQSANALSLISKQEGISIEFKLLQEKNDL